MALDPTEGVLGEAVRLGAQMVVTHHPLLFRPLLSMDTSRYVPRLLAGFLRSGVALLACHTNLDSARGGVSELLAQDLGLTGLSPLVSATCGGNIPQGLGRVGDIPGGCTLEDMVRRVARVLSCPSLFVVGRPKDWIDRVGICAGSGSDLWPMVVDAGAQLYISSEIKHHVAREAEQTRTAIIDAGHFYTEWRIVPALTDYLRKIAAERGWRLKISFYEEESSPFGLWLGEKGGGNIASPGEGPASV